MKDSPFRIEEKYPISFLLKPEPARTSRIIYPDERLKKEGWTVSRWPSKRRDDRKIGARARRRTFSKRLTFKGIKYCNELELRMAKLLDANNIKFEYSKKFPTTDEETGQSKHREVDFWLETPIEIFWCTEPVQAIEVKGKKDRRSWYQKRELRAVGIETYIADPLTIDFWEREGFLKEKGLRPRSKRRNRVQSKVE